MKNLLLAAAIGAVVAVIWMTRRDEKRTFKVAQATGGVRA